MSIGLQVNQYDLYADSGILTILESLPNSSYYIFPGLSALDSQLDLYPRLIAPWSCPIEHIGALKLNAKFDAWITPVCIVAAGYLAFFILVLVFFMCARGIQDVSKDFSWMGFAAAIFGVIFQIDFYLEIRQYFHSL